MNLTISSIGVNSNTNYPKLKTYTKQNPAFNSRVSSKAIKGFGMAVAAASILSFASCTNRQNSTSDDNTVGADSYIVKNNNPEDFKDEIKHYYHYFPRENNDLQSAPYDWVETIYPNGKIEKDSFEYKIVIEPNGERTATKTTADADGNKIVTTYYPDGSKIECTYYKTKFIDETKYEEKSYWSNKKIKSVIFINEYHSDSLNISSPKISEQSIDSYNQNGILIRWDSNVKEPERNEKNNKYDRLKRIVYNDVTQEKYQYKGKKKTPYRSVAEKDGCLRITLYDNEGEIQRIYFKAIDGTITEL